MTAVAGAPAAAGTPPLADIGVAATACSLTPLPLSVAQADRATMLRTTPERSTLLEQRRNIRKTYLERLISGSSDFGARSRKLTVGIRLVT